MGGEGAGVFFFLFLFLFLFFFLGFEILSAFFILLFIKIKI